ncbi:response regulator transcription factor [Niallia taxi]|uniref:response regulator transcription factor n=1 Tax=Niallia taxi TaxID=2499688 RepID=UPI003D2DAD4F
MIESNTLQFLSDLQKVYSELTGLSITIIDGTGKKILPAEIAPDLGPIIDQHMDIDPNYMDKIIKFAKLDTAFVYDIAVDGVKIIVSSFQLNHSYKPYYILGGIVVEAGTQAETIENVQASSVPDDVKTRVINFIDKRGGLTPAAINKTLKTMSVMGNNVKYLLSLQAGADRIVRNLPALQLSHSPSVLTVDQLLTEFKKQTDVLDLICYAPKVSNNEYEVSNAVGEFADKILGLKFKNGEGFMGFAGVSPDPQTWKEIERDPRTSVFLDLGLGVPSEIWCNPIRLHETTDGILFIINFAKRPASQISSLINNMVTSVLTAKLKTTLIIEGFMKQKQRLVGLVEVSNFLKQSTDVKSVLYALVDISLNLVSKPKSSTIFFTGEPVKKKVKIISRGTTAYDTENYVKEASKRLFLAGNDKVELTGSVKKLPNNDYLYEYPISFNNEIYGALAVQFSDSYDIEDCCQLLSTLVIMGSMLLNNLLNKKRDNSFADEMAIMLHSSLEIKDVCAFDKINEMNKAVSGFVAANPSIAEISDILNRAILVSAFEPDLLLKSPYLTEESEIVRQYREIASKSIREEAKYSKEAQILAIAQNYIGNDNWYKAIERNKGIDKELLDMFKHHVDTKAIFDIDLTIEFEEEEQLQPTQAPIIESIAKEYGLTNREKDIFEYIIQAYSNKDIAKNLYISEHTVKNHITNIFNKLGVSDRMQAVSLVLKNRIN